MVRHFPYGMNPEGQHDDRKDNVSTPTFVPVEHHALNHGLLANAGPPHSEQEPPEYPQAELPADEPNNPQAAPRFEIPEGARVLTVTVAAPAALAHFRLEQYRDWDYLAGPSAEECSLSDTPTELLVLYQQARPLEEDVRLRTLWLAQQTVIRAGTQADVQHQPYDPRLTGGPMRIRIPGYLNGPNPFHPLDTVYGRHFISVQACQSAGLVEGRDYIIEGIRNPTDILLCGHIAHLEETLHGRTIALRDEDLRCRRPGPRSTFGGPRAMPAEDVIPEPDEYT